jgi:hypothetical protein
MLADAEKLWRLNRGLRHFFTSPLSASDCRSLLSAALRSRAANFLAMVRGSVYGHARSPYLALARYLGIEMGDIERLVEREGVEGALERLYESGFHVSLDEFKGKRAICRGNFTLAATAEDFDNPVLAGGLPLQSGGSTGAPRRLVVDLDLLIEETAARYLFLEAHRFLDRPCAVYRITPPGSSGIKHALRAAKLGRPLERWFTPSPVRWTGPLWKSNILLRTIQMQGLASAAGIPSPEYVDPAAPESLAQWLAGKKATGAPALLSCSANTGVQVAAYCSDKGHDIAGTVFWLGGEPITAAKLGILEKAGVTSVSGWSLSEAGTLAIPCARREHIDEAHVLESKVAVLEKPVEVKSTGESVDALQLTTLIPHAPKVMLNVDVGDTAVLTRRDCGCPIGAAGFGLRLHTIRNYEKLTARGMHFMGVDVLKLVDEILPTRHGGLPSSYQFVEEEIDGQTRVGIVVSPLVKDLNQAALIETVAGFLGSGSTGERMMADEWRRNGVLRIKRAEPFRTLSGKVPALRVLPKR